MGANCCVAARDKPLPYQTRFEVSTQRNIRYSPSWSFRWNNRTHIEDIMDNSSLNSHQNNGYIGSETKTESECLSDGGRPRDAFRMPKWRKTALKTGNSGHDRFGGADWSPQQNLSAEDKIPIKSAGVASASDTKSSLSIPSTPSSSPFIANPSESTLSRKTHCSPDDQISRQVSDSRIPAFNSLNENNSPEERHSFVLSTCGNDFSVGGSQGGSCDGWSMRTFAELVASSQRERWSFDSENQSSIRSRLAKSNNQPSASPSADSRSCGICSKQLKDRSPWSPQKIVASNELNVVAVLVCGHVYHAECLEGVTPEADRYDPYCLLCTHGEKYGLKIMAKAECKSRNKISRIAVVADGDGDGDPGLECQKHGKGRRLGVSSSLKSAFSRPFLRRHFSLGPRPPARSMSESKSSSRKKGFWARYQNE